MDGNDIATLYNLGTEGDPVLSSDPSIRPDFALKQSMARYVQRHAAQRDDLGNHEESVDEGESIARGDLVAMLPLANQVLASTPADGEAADNTTTARKKVRKRKKSGKRTSDGPVDSESAGPAQS